MYKTGQAVITKHFNDLLFVIKQSELETEKYFCSNLNGVSNLISIERPATEAEILAEAEKHGWKTATLSKVSPKRYFHLIKDNNGVWDWFNSSITKADINLKEYCEEGLKAHTLITALNLVNA